jgi:hypothetical protein
MQKLPKFLGYFKLILANMGWATFLAIFSQTHQVTLFAFKECRKSAMLMEILKSQKQIRSICKGAFIFSDQLILD